MVDSSLIDVFNFTRFQPLLQALMETDPINLLDLLETFSPLVREKAGESWPIIEQMLYQYRYKLLTVSSIAVTSDRCIMGY